MNASRLQAGFGLVELLIAMLIIAVGLLGIIAVQVRSTQAEMESYQRAQAMLLLDDIGNRMRANSGNLLCYVLANDGIANLGMGAENYAGTGCNVLASNDLVAWNNLLLGATETLDNNNVGAMVGARGCITYDAAADTYTLTIAWQGLSDTFAPLANTCGEGQYLDERRRRIASISFRIGTLL